MNNLFYLFVFFAILIIIINVLGGSITFYDRVKFSFNEMIYQNANTEAFIDSEELYHKLNELTNNNQMNHISDNKKSNTQSNNNNANSMDVNVNNNEVKEKFTVQSNKFNGQKMHNDELMNDMTTFKPFNSNDGKNNIQSNLIDICNHTQQSIVDILHENSHV